MKLLTSALVLGMSLIGSAMAANPHLQNNQQQEDDALYGYRGVGTPSKAEVQPASIMGTRKNQQQEDDQIYGYRVTGSPSKSQPQPASTMGTHNNQQQEDDQIYGYRK